MKFKLDLFEGKETVEKAGVRDEITALIEPAVATLGYELVGCEVFLSSGRSLVRVYIDSPTGVTVADCEAVSRQVGAILDVEDLMRGRYHLEVSSPGTDRPLFTLAHYQRFLGRQVRVRLHTPLNERRNFMGLLKSTDSDSITLIVDGQTWTLPLAAIEKANLVPDTEV